MSDVFGDAFKELAAHDAEVVIDPAKKPEPAAAPEPVVGDLPNPADTSTLQDGKTLVLEDDDKSTVTAKDGITIETAEQTAAREATEAAKVAEKATKDAADAAAAAATTQADKPGSVTLDDAALERLAKIMRPAEPAKVDAPAPPRFNEEEQAIVTAFEKDFPDVARAQEIIRAAEYKEIVNYVFAQIAPRLNAVEAAAGQVVGDTHMAQLQAQVPDYETVAPEVLKWIDQQPDYLKATYQAVAQKGTVPQVVDMINRYRAATGQAAPDGGETPEQKAAAAAEATRVAAEAAKATPKKVAAALAPVATKRSGQTTGTISADDFEGAFSAFASLADA